MGDELIDTAAVATLVIPEHARTVLDVIAAAARDPQTDPAKLALLFELKERVDRTLAEKAFNVAMSAAQGEMPLVIKDAENSHTHSKYARLESIDKAIRPVYTRHGFSLSFNSGPPQNPEAVRILCDVAHIAGFTKKYELEGELDESGSKGQANKTSIQGLGSSVSYLRRYLTCMIFNITVAGEDNDGNPWKNGKERAAKMAADKLEKLRAGERYRGPEPPLKETLEASVEKEQTKKGDWFSLLRAFKELHKRYSDIGADEAYYATLDRFGVQKSNQFAKTDEGFDKARKCFRAMGKELPPLEHADSYGDWEEVPTQYIDSGQPVRVGGVLYVISEESANYRAMNSIPSAS